MVWLSHLVSITTGRQRRRRERKERESRGGRVGFNHWETQVEMEVCKRERGPEREREVERERER